MSPVCLLTMVKTREMPESIRNTFIKKHNNSEGYKTIAKDLEIPVSAVCNVIKFYSHKPIKVLQGHGTKKKLSERSLG